jgi:hypothetical protein
MAVEKQGGCGCGCLPVSKPGSKGQKPEDQKPEGE